MKKRIGCPWCREQVRNNDESVFYCCFGKRDRFCIWSEDQTKCPTGEEVIKIAETTCQECDHLIPRTCWINETGTDEEVYGCSRGGEPCEHFKMKWTEFKRLEAKAW